MIEQSQISDKAIMAGTQVEAQQASGRIRFVTKLPSGKPLESEWLQESSKTQGVLRWCEAVRGAIVQDAAEQEEERKARVLASRGARLVAASSQPPAIFPAMTELPAPSSSSNAALPSMSDPAAFLTQAVKNAEQAEAHWRVQAATATANWQAALADLAKWRQIAQSLNLPQTLAPAVSAPNPTSAGPELSLEEDIDDTE